MTTPITTKPSSIASRLKSFGVVHAALTTHSVLDATSNASYRELFDHLAAELEMVRAGMISANTAHLGQLARIVDLRQRRDGLTGTLFSRFSKARRIIETLYGSPRSFELLAISGDTPSTPTGLVAQVHDSVGFLENPRVATPAIGLLGIELDRRAMATQLAAGADELDSVLVELDEAQKQADVTRVAKNAAIEAYDDKFLRVARVAESVFHLAGMHQLAKRVRPSTRRPGRRLADEGGETNAPETEAGVPETETQPVEARADASGQSDAPPIDGRPLQPVRAASGAVRAFRRPSVGRSRHHTRDRLVVDDLWKAPMDSNPMLHPKAIVGGADDRSTLPPAASPWSEATLFNAFSGYHRPLGQR